MRRKRRVAVGIHENLHIVDVVAVLVDPSFSANKRDAGLVNPSNMVFVCSLQERQFNTIVCASDPHGGGPVHHEAAEHVRRGQACEAAAQTRI